MGLLVSLAERALVAGNSQDSGSSFLALVPGLASVEEEENKLVSGSSSLALVPRPGGDSVAEKALAAENLLVSGSSSPALVPGLASV